MSEDDVDRIWAQHSENKQKLFSVTFELYRARDYYPALMLAGRLRRCGFIHPVALGIEAHLGLVLGSGDDLTVVLDQLEGAVSSAPAADLTWLAASVGARVREEVISASEKQNHDRVNGLFKIVRFIFPSLCDGLIEQFIADRIPEAKPSRPLLTFERPPKDGRRSRSVVVAVSERFHPANPQSRLLDIGPLIVAALDGYGWKTAFYGLQSLSDRPLIQRDWDALLRLCRDHQAEAVFIQEFLPDTISPDDLASFTSALRRACPGLQVVALYFDPWDRQRWPAIRAAAEVVDRIWAPWPSLALWSGETLREKVMFLPIPHEGLGGYSGPSRSRGMILSFVGGVDSANWPRAFWLSSLKKAGVPLRVTITQRRDNQMPPLESHRAYMKSLGAAGCALNFSRRLDGSKILTGRTFEAILAGALLVQERTEDVDYYFTSNEHYLEFSTVGDIIQINEMIRREPEKIMEMRWRAFRHYQAHYSGAQIAACLDKLLFYPS